MPNTVWNSADKTGSITLSNTDHTASATGGGNLGVRATIPHSVGKWFISYSDILNAGGSGRVGFGTLADTLGAGGQFGIDPGGNVHDPAGGTHADMGGSPDGHVVDFAVDLDNAKYWLRYDGGNWNGGLNGDPVAGTGSYSLAGLTTPIYPFVWLQNNPGSCTLDGGDYPSPTFPYPPPSNFIPWNGGNIWASTEAPDTFAAIGYPGAFGIIGFVNASEAPDVFAAAGYQPVSGPMISFETPDHFSAFAFQPLTGVWVSTEAKDIFHATGIGQGEDGVWVSTEAPDIFAATGIVPIVGTFETTEAPDRFFAIGAGVIRVRRRRIFYVT